MKTQYQRVATSCLLGLLSLPWGLRSEGIPEPGLVLYGVVRNNTGGQSIRLTTGTLVWRFHPLGGGADVVITNQLTNLLDQFSYVMVAPCESVLGTLQASVNALVMTTPPKTYDRTNVSLDGQPIFLAPPASQTIVVGAAARGQVERVDLSLAREDADADGDGLPDWWENLFFSGNANPDADPDGDGIDNRHEYLTGTDPNDAQSVFRFIHIERPSQTEAFVKWNSVPSKTYTLLRCSALTSGPGQFSVVQSGILATPPVNTFTDVTASGPGPYFYLLRTE
jgi:hypothetical protein